MARYLCLALVLVTSLSCGGGGGTGPGPGPGPDPIEIASTADDARAATATVGVAGGSVSATAADGTVLLLSVPEGALPALTAITLTPLTSVSRLPYSGGLLAGAEVTPVDLKISTPVVLLITPPAALNPTTAHGFTIATPAPSGAAARGVVVAGEFGAYPSEPVDGEGTSAPAMEMRLFAGGAYGIGMGTGGEVNLPSARDASRTAELAHLLDSARASGTPLTTSTLRASLIALFERDWPAIIAACPGTDATPAEVEAFRAVFNRWHQQVQQTGLEGEFAEEIDAGLDCLEASSLAFMEASLGGCSARNAMEALFWSQFLFWTGGLDRPGGDTTSAELFAMIDRCVRFELTLDEAFTTHESGNSYEIRYTATIPLRVGSGFALKGDAPLTFHSAVPNFEDTGCCVTEILPISADQCAIEDIRPPFPGEPLDKLVAIFREKLADGPSPVEVLRFNCTACDPPSDQQIPNGYWYLSWFAFYQPTVFEHETRHLLTDWAAGAPDIVAERRLSRSVPNMEEIGLWQLRHTPAP